VHPFGRYNSSVMDITLALGGGGSRGAAHVGVLRILEREGFRVRGIAGTSVGSIIASFYAAGFSPDEIEKRITDIDFTRLYGRLLSDGPGLLGVTGIQNWLRMHLGERTFASLRIPCAVVAVDLATRREITFRDGSVVDSILGSIAVPGIFPPHDYGEFRLIDGGTLDPVPVQAARELAPKLPVAAVVLASPPEGPYTSWNISLPVPQLIADRLIRFRITQAFGIFLEAVDIGQRSISALRLEVDKPEVLIRPNVTNVSFLGDIDVKEVVQRGEAGAREALPELKRAVSWQARLARRLNMGSVR
jgi:NTE family protein